MIRRSLTILGLALSLAYPAAAMRNTVKLLPSAQRLLCNAKPSSHALGHWVHSTETHTFNGVPNVSIVYEGTPTSGAVAVPSGVVDLAPSSTTSQVTECVVQACVGACVGYVIENPKEALSLAKSFAKVSLWAGKKVIGYFFPRESALADTTTAPSVSNSPSGSTSHGGSPSSGSEPPRESGYGKHFNDAKKLDQKIPDNKLHRTYREHLELFRHGGAMVVNETAQHDFFAGKKPGDTIGRPGATWLVAAEELKAFLKTNPTLAELEDKLGLSEGSVTTIRDKTTGKKLRDATKVYIYFVDDPLALNPTLPDKATPGANECYDGGGQICTAKKREVSFAEIVVTANVPYAAPTEYSHKGN